MPGCGSFASRRLVYTWEDFVEEFLPIVEDFVAIFGVAVDWMHSKHLGLDQRMLGSVLWLLTFHIFKSRGSIEERLALLLHKFKEYWRQNAVHGALNSLTLGVLAIVGLLFFSVVFPMCFKKKHSLFRISNGEFMQV